MTSLVMLAIMVDRTALSLRNVMFAATVILLFLPEALLNPSFQLSFSAVIALIAGYESLQSVIVQWQAGERYFNKIIGYGLGILATTVIATLATTPFTLYTFNQCTLHSMWSNFLAIPLTSFWIMPLEFMSILAIPLGLETYIFPFLQKGLCLLKTIAIEVSKWPYATLSVPKSSSFCLTLIVLSGLWICLWQRKWRWLGTIPLIYGTFLLCNPSKTYIYIDTDRSLVGIRDNKILYLTSLHKSKFTAHLWQKHSGNLLLKSLKSHPNISCNKGHCMGTYQGKPIEILLNSSRKNPKCQVDTMLINLKNNLVCENSRTNIIKKDLVENKGHLIKENGIITMSQLCGKRAWS